MNNKETLQNYNEQLNTNNLSLATVLERINNLPEKTVQQLQDKSITITENTTQTISADEGYDALNTIEITTNVVEDLNEGLTTYDTNLDTQEVTINDIKNALKNKAVSGGSSMNLFVQEEEPETKDGIWVKTSDKTVENVYITTGITIDMDITFGESNTSFPIGVREYGACAIGKDIYVFGGLTSSGNSNRAFKYNTTNDEFTELSTMPYAAYGIAVVNNGTDIYLFGGRASSGVNNAYKYNTLDDTYTELTSLPTGTGQFTATLYNGEIYMFGGYTTGVSALAYKYNIESDSYTQLASLPSARNCVATALYKNRIYIIGGYNGNAMTATLYYNIDTNEYTTLTPLPSARFASAMVIYNKELIIMGGQGSSRSNVVFLYNVETDTMQTYEKTLSTAVVRASGVLVGNKIYIIGGYAETTYSSIIQTGLISSGADELVYDKNTLIINTEQTGTDIKLITSGMSLEMKMSNVLYYSTESGIDYSTEILYGDGTQWTSL